MAVDSVLLAAAGGGEEAEVQGAAEVERCSVHREEVVVEGSEAEEEDEAVAAAVGLLSLRPFCYNANPDLSLAHACAVLIPSWS